MNIGILQLRTREIEPIPFDRNGTSLYRCPDCNAFIVRAKIPPNALIQRKCRCSNNFLLEIAGDGSPQFVRNEDAQHDLVDLRCGRCHKLVLKYRPAKGLRMSAQCTRRVCARPVNVQCVIDD